MKAVKRKLIVKPVEEKEESSTGIISNPDKKPDSGEVISKGELVTDEIPQGSIVYFSEYAGKAVTVEGEDYILLSEDEIYCVI